MSVKSKTTIQGTIDFCEDELSDVARFLGYLKSSKKVSEIPGHFENLYDHDLSQGDNIEINREKIHDLRRKIESLKRLVENV